MVRSIFKKVFKRKRFKRGGEINPEDIFLDSSNLAGLDAERMEGTLDKPISTKVQILPFFFLMIIIGVFLFQLFNLQVKNFTLYKEKADNNRYNAHLILADRGNIYDRNGNPLAENIVSSSSPILKRMYIRDGGFSNLLGYVSYPKMDNLNNYWQENYEGKDGVELIYQDLLRGVNGRQLVERDVLSAVETDNTIVRPVSGANLNLTIDKGVQKILFDSIREAVNRRGFISGSGVIMDVNNGEVLAMTSYPEYDNNLMTNATGTEDNKKISNALNDKRTPFLNRPVSGLFTPGSVVKPFMAYAALNEGVISPTKQILSTGALIIKNPYGGPDSVFRDWKVHGWVDVVRALARSSDEYFYQVGGGYGDQEGLGIARIDNYATLFGLATITNIDLPGEVTSVIPTPEWKRINFIDGEWKLGNTYHTSIGQYGFQVTPVALVRYISAIANDGKLVTPHIFLSASSSEGLANFDLINKYNSKIWPTVDLNLNASSLKYVKQGMRAVVQEGGTVPQLNIPGLNVAAKSGTAEIGVVKGRVNSLIVGYFPYDNPKYAYAIVMENGPVDAPGASWAAKPVLEYIRDHKADFIKE